MTNQPLKLERILAHYRRGFRARADAHILVDLCSIKRIPSYQETPLLDWGEYIPMITGCVHRQMREYSHLVPPSVFDFFNETKNEPIFPPVSERNRNLINEAARLSEARLHPQYAKKSESADNVDLLGFPDTQMISYAMDRAREDEQTIIVSDDGGILKTLSHLRKKSPERKAFHPNMFSFGIRNFVEEIYPQFRGQVSPYIIP